MLTGLSVARKFQTDKAPSQCEHMNCRPSWCHDKDVRPLEERNKDQYVWRISTRVSHLLETMCKQFPMFFAVNSNKQRDPQVLGLELIDECWIQCKAKRKKKKKRKTSRWKETKRSCWAHRHHIDLTEIRSAFNRSVNWIKKKTYACWIIRILT